jgi:Rieske Fe-S protein
VVHDGVATPHMRKQLRVLAALAVFVAVVVVMAFFAAFRNTGGTTTAPTRWRLDTTGLQEGDYRADRATTDVVLNGQEYHVIDLYVVRVHGQVHALWSRSTHLGCRTVPTRDAASVDRATVFEDPCGGSVFGLDGSCLSGPCPRALDEFTVELRNGVAYANLTRVLTGHSRSRS